MFSFEKGIRDFGFDRSALMLVFFVRIRLRLDSTFHLRLSPLPRPPVPPSSSSLQSKRWGDSHGTIFVFYSLGWLITACIDFVHFDPDFLFVNGCLRDTKEREGEKMLPLGDGGRTVECA